MNSTFHFGYLTNKMSEGKIFLTHLSDENKTQMRKGDKSSEKYDKAMFVGNVISVKMMSGKAW